MPIRLYREWLCTGCGETWEWKSQRKAGGKPKHCPQCEPHKGPLPCERLA